MRLLLVVVSIMVLCETAVFGADMKIAILRDSFPIRASFAGPERLAGTLRQARNAVDFVSSDQLADPNVFNADQYWLVILPYGSYFPAKARENFLAYLRAGGAFLSTGGYAFDTPVIRWNGKWLTKQDATSLPSSKSAGPQPDTSILETPINMREGKPNDFLEWEKEQIGVFDAGYRLTGGKAVTPAPDQHIIPSTFSVKGKIEGWAAAGTTGSGWCWTEPTHRSRLIPLLATTDEFGRQRGSAGSMMVNTLEPYRGSIWAYFGVESRDIFSEPGAGEMLVSLVNAMKQGAFLHDLHSSYACYRQGEDVVITGSVSDFGKQPASGLVQIDVTNEQGSPVYFDSIPVSLAAGETKQISTKWQSAIFKDDFYTVKADLVVENQPVDTLRTGFYIWSQQTLAKGMPLSYSGNYLRDNDRPRFLLGVEAFYDRNCPAGMDPLDVERDFSDMADLGFHVSRAFTYSDTETDIRFRDALVMAAQRHRVDFWLSGTAPMCAYLDNPALISLPEAIGERYRGVQGMMIDLANEPNFHEADSASRDARFNEYLHETYGSDDALRAAWGDELGKDEKLGMIKMGWIKHDWLSIRSRDVYRFLIKEGSKWVSDVTGAIKEKDPSRIVSVGYLQSWPGMVMDPALTSDALDFMDRHWYNKISETRAFDVGLVMSDRRYRGKAPSIGEFGSKTYPTFKETGHNYDTTEQQELRYLHVGHYTLALGGIFASNWHWRDPQGSIFPYGIVYSDFTPKPAAKTYRAMSLLFSGLRPKYIEPEVYLVLPDESRIGGGSEPIVEAIGRSANALIDAGLRFGTINEWNLALLPKSARLLVMPTPFALSEPAYQKLKDFVSSGGVLYTSGDISYDEDRRRTKTNRLEELAGVKCKELLYPDVRLEKGTRELISYGRGMTYMGSPTMRIEPMTSAMVIANGKGGRVAVINKVGKGEVLFSADPAELVANSPLSAIYLRAACEAGVAGETVTPATKDIQVFRLPCEEGEAVIVGNVGDKAARVTVNAGGRDYSVFVAPKRQAMVITKNGKLVGLESQGDVTRDGKTVFSGSHHFFAITLDNQDLTESGEIAVVGLKAGKYSTCRTGLLSEAGEIGDGRWRILKNMNGGINVSDSLAGDIVLLATPASMEQARDNVATLLAR